ncbi:MAG: hypothetical protein ACLQIB_35945 [Isosphaeraceae bacterium]
MNLTFAATASLEQHPIYRPDVKQFSEQKRCLSAPLSGRPVMGH